METKKKKNPFQTILYILIFLFIIAYTVGESGYYESTLNNEVQLTSDAIDKFEEDVLNGEEVDLKDYVVEKNADYSNIFTKTGEKIGSITVNALSKTTKHVLNVIGLMIS